MKKRTYFVILMVLLILAVTASAGSADTRRLSLLHAKSKYGSASVFTFMVWGDFGNFTGTAYHSGNAYNLNCALKSGAPNILICRGPNYLAEKMVQVVVNGYSFSTYVDLGAQEKVIIACASLPDDTLVSVEKSLSALFICDGVQ